MSPVPFYDINPIGVIDQNRWDLKMAEVNLAFHNAGAIYTPLMDWDASPMATGAMVEQQFELMEGEVDPEPIPLTANYIEAGMGVDSRSRKWTVTRYGDKVQYHKSSTYFNQWKMSGGRDWRPLLRSLLGYNVVEKHEMLARQVWFKSPQSYWTYGGNATSWASIDTNDRFGLDIINDWRFRLGNTGSPVIPGDQANAKVAIIPPGATYDFMKALAAASTNEASMWRDARIYSGQALKYEIGEHKGMRFIEVPNDKFGTNKNVLYNCGAIVKQYAVTKPIQMGDGAPDPETTAVDSVWYVGQKNVTHSIELENFAAGDYVVNDVVTIHVKTTAAYGVTGGVDPFAGKCIQRRVVAVDATANTLSFDRPILFNYTAAFAGQSVTGNTAGTFYGYVTKARHIGFALVLGSRGGVQGKVLEPIQFYEPEPIDDFRSVWRATWDEIIGYNLADPNFFELHFFAVSTPKPGGITS